MASGSGRWRWASWTITRGTVAHLQWYLSETTEDLVHGFSQGIQKCGLPRAAMSDNGSAMLAEEFTRGVTAAGDPARNDPAVSAPIKTESKNVSGRTWKDG